MAICAWSLPNHLDALAAVLAQHVDGLELGDLRDPLVGELGQHLLLGVLHEHPERDLFPRALAEALGELLGELEDVAGLLAAQLDVEGRDEHPGPDLVEEVGRGEAFDRLVVDEALDVDLREVAVDERRLGVLEVGEALAQLVDLGVDRLVVRCGCRRSPPATRRSPRP